LEHREKEKSHHHREKKAASLSPRTPSSPHEKRSNAIIVENLDQQSSGLYLFIVKEL
jgi:hypothetical protein